MTDYLVFTLAATIGSMGELAGHERRGSYYWPGRSAIIGLLGAALGIKRDENFSELDQLGIAVADFTDDTRREFRDFHTIQSIPTAQSKNANSRPEALKKAGKTKVATSITYRDYYTNCLYGVAVWGGDLEALKGALNTPEFTLYLGRKSCPLASPVMPKIVTADNVEEAFSMISLPHWRKNAVAKSIMADANDNDTYIETRHDQAIDRKLWHFKPRRVATRFVHIKPKGE